MITTEGVKQPERNIADVQESYKYVGILKANGSHVEATGESATATYL